jgi:hypothetical protein
VISQGVLPSRSFTCKFVSQKIDQSGSKQKTNQSQAQNKRQTKKAEKVILLFD